MRTALIVLTAGAMLAMPLIGNVQQVPGESTRKPPAAADLQALIAAQTEAIQALHKRVVTLEARVKKLEDERAGGNPR
jgi:hypothetical protein